MSETKHTPGPMVRDGHNMSSVIICTVPRGHPDAKHVCGDYEVIARCEGDNWSANAARIVLTWNCHDELVAALKCADEFIRNGIELGYIRMPNASTPDTAHDTPGIVAAALSRATTPTP